MNKDANKLTVGENKNNPQEKTIRVIKVEKKPRFLNSILMGVGNIIALVFLFIILFSLPKEAGELKRIKNEILNPDLRDKISAARNDLRAISQKSDKVISLFPDDSGVVEFVKEIDKLKVSGVVKNFAFANKEEVKDKTGAYGIPFVLELEGSWQSINGILEYMQKLPYLIRAITVDVKVGDENVVNFKYGGFIYVRKSIVKN